MGDRRRSDGANARRRSESGVGMVATLAVVVILGVLVTVVLVGQPGTPSSTSPLTGTSSSATGGTTSTTTQVSSVDTDTSAATIAACRGNYSIILAAISDYETLNGAPPPAGTSWATTPAQSALLDSWPSGLPYYSLVWNGHQLDVVPHHGAVSHGSAGSPSPPTGCYAS